MDNGRSMNHKVGGSIPERFLKRKFLKRNSPWRIKSEPYTSSLRKTGHSVLMSSPSLGPRRLNEAIHDAYDMRTTL